MLCRRSQSWSIRAWTGTTCPGLRWDTLRRGLARQVDWEDLAASDEEADAGGQRKADTQRRGHGRYMGIVASRMPDSTAIGDLVEQIQPSSLGKSKPNPRPSLLVVLLTPRFARQAQSANLPLQVLERFGDNPTNSKALDAVTAVVDKLPCTNGQNEAEEGLAYTFLTHPPPLDNSGRLPLQVTTQKPGSIRWGIPHFQGTTALSVQLPLANTVFSTGLPSTLIHKHYRWEEQNKVLKEESSEHLESQKLRVPIASKTASKHLHAPLLPLTPLRRVMNSMGNIVRKVSPNTAIEDLHLKMDPNYAPNTQAFMTASQELESAVSDYFKSADLPPEPVEVWALILPDVPSGEADFIAKPYLALDKGNIRNMWTSPQDLAKITGSGQWLELLNTGARLCKVLSGGGGWGKKAGLLSLDPDTVYSTRELRGDDGWNFDFEDDGTTASFERQQAQALGQIVKEGESIMFFIAPKRAQNTPMDQGTSLHGSTGSAVFGPLPSSIDSLDNEASLKSSGDKQQAVHFPNMFGMLSEGGMAVEFLDKVKSRQSKVDIPHARLRVTTGNSPDSEQSLESFPYTRERLSDISRANLNERKSGETKNSKGDADHVSNKKTKIRYYTVRPV